MGENVKHFSLEEKNDNTYGWPWNEVVKTFLQSHYNDEEKQCSIKIRNKEYKILKRESVTVFYDADGNTLFDVTNDRLEKEYESGVSDAEEELENNVPVEPMGEIIEETKQEAFEAVISEGEKNTKTEDFVPMGTASLADIVGGLPTPTDETIKKAEDENARNGFMRKRKMYLSVEDIAELFELSVSFAYRVVERMNADLASKNYYVILGRVPTRYVEDKIYGLEHVEQYLKEDKAI